MAAGSDECGSPCQQRRGPRRRALHCCGTSLLAAAILLCIQLQPCARCEEARGAPSRFKTVLPDSDPDLYVLTPGLTAGIAEQSHVAAGDDGSFSLQAGARSGHLITSAHRFCRIVYCRTSVDAAVPDGASVMLRYRAAATAEALRGLPFKRLVCADRTGWGVRGALPQRWAGSWWEGVRLRWFQVKITLTANAEGESPRVTRLVVENADSMRRVTAKSLAGFVLVVVVLGVGTCLLLRLLFCSVETRRALLKVFLAALAVRLIAVFPLQLANESFHLAGDEWTFNNEAANVVRRWRGEWGLGAPGHAPLIAYVSGALYYAFGPRVILPKAVNIVVASWSIVYLYLLGLRFFSRRAATLAAVMATAFPSFVLWSCLHLREAFAYFFLLGLCYHLLRYRDGRPWSLLPAGVHLAGLALLRPYLAGALAAAAVLAVLAVFSWRQKLILVGPVVAAVLAAGMLAGFDALPHSLPSLAWISRKRTELASEGSSSFRPDVDISTPGRALRFLPTGAFYFLFMPVPWSTRGLLQTLTIPESAAWYVLVVFAVAAVARVRDADWRAVLTIVCFIACITAVYAIGEGNFGTAYRHRSLLFPLVFLLASCRLVAAWDRLVRRKRAAPLTRRMPPPPPRW